MLCACNSKLDDADANTILVNKKGKIVEAAVEEFQDGFDSKDIKKYVKESITTYNDEYGKRISLKSFKEKDGVVKAIIEYDSVEDYNTFNMKSYEWGEVKDIDLQGAFIDIDGKEYDVANIEDGYKVLKVDSPTCIKISGKVVSYTDNLLFEDDIYTCPEGETAYIIVN